MEKRPTESPRGADVVEDLQSRVALQVFSFLTCRTHHAYERGSVALLCGRYQPILRFHGSFQKLGGNTVVDKFPELGLSPLVSAFGSCLEHFETVTLRDQTKWCLPIIIVL